MLLGTTNGSALLIVPLLASTMRSTARAATLLPLETLLPLASPKSTSPAAWARTTSRPLHGRVPEGCRLRVHDETGIADAANLIKVGVPANVTGFPQT